MGCCKLLLGFILLSGVLLAITIAYLNNPGPPISIDKSGYWGPQKLPVGGASPKDDEKIHSFTISYDDNLIKQLREQLKTTKWVEPLENSQYHYGINLNTFRHVVEYWQTKFDFKKAENDINAFKHYKTQIEGLKIHFYRSKPNVPAGTKVFPLLLVHGWPGSFVEFLKITHLLNKPVDGIAFDVIVPSIPGYGYSEAPSKQGVNCLVTARIFSKLMTRLGFEKFFMQGGDWGSAITASMGRLFPERLLGVHFNMLFGAHNPRFVLKQMALSFFPSVFGDKETPKCLQLPFTTSFMRLLRESGYMHIQSTKPDTIGFTLLNSPAGLAGYIAEKFSTWTEDGFRELEDGGLTKKFSLDDILANIMVYYATDTIVSSVRYYRENMLHEDLHRLHDDKITVPAAYAVFPNEIACIPSILANDFFTNLTAMTYMPDGGHFAAFEQPDLLAKDVRSFVKNLL